MVRFIAAILLLSVGPLRAQEIVPTHCEESEVAIDRQHTATRLGRCGDNIPSDTLWHLDRIDQIGGNLDGHFVRRNRGTGTVVYVMDTGVFAAHDEFATSSGSRVIAGFDRTRDVPVGESRCRSANKATAPCWSDTTELTAASHGTSVASLIAGKNVGVAPDASIVSVRVMNESGLTNTRAYLDGLDAIIVHAWSAAAPPFHTAVVNISGWVLDHLSNSSDDPSHAVSYGAVEKKMLDMIAGVDAAGTRDPDGKRFLFVVAGNNIDGGCGRAGVVDRFPAILGREFDGIVTVGGMTQDNSSWIGSCRGGVEVLAPAQSIFSATITAHDHYRGRHPNLRSGTSFAAPIISGIAAILIAEHPEMTPEQLEQWITSTPSRVDDPDETFAGGKVAYANASPPPVRTLVQRITAAP